MLAEPGGHAVVHHHALIVEHQPVSTAADAEFRPGIRVHPVEKSGGIGPLDIDLAERRGIEKTGRSAHGRAFSLNGVRERFAGAGIGEGPQPDSRRLEGRAVSRMPWVHRRLASRLEALAAAGSDDGPEGDRRVGWALPRSAISRGGRVHAPAACAGWQCSRAAAPRRRVPARCRPGPRRRAPAASPGCSPARR